MSLNNKSSNDTKGQVELESVDINEMESVNKKYDSLQVESEISDLKSKLEKTKKELEQEDQNIEKDKTIMKDKTTNLDKINSELVEATQLYEQLASQ